MILDRSQSDGSAESLTHCGTTHPLLDRSAIILGLSDVLKTLKDAGEMKMDVLSAVAAHGEPDQAAFLSAAVSLSSSSLESDVFSTRGL
jgi:hypothetical protein